MKTFYSLNKGGSLFFEVYSRKAEGRGGGGGFFLNLCFFGVFIKERGGGGVGGGVIVLIELVLCVSCFYLELCFSEQQQQTL